MKIEDLSPQKNSKSKTKRVGRGTGSGHGKTSCKGHKGLKARAGGGKGGGFEGGQMPLIRRLPKRGFKNVFRTKYEIINLDRLSVFDDGVVVTPLALKEKGIIKNQESKVKILGDGELKKRLIIHANKFSNSALESIKSKGGEAVVLSEKSN